MSRTVSFIAGATAGVIGGVYLAQTYGEKLPNVQATVQDLIAKAQVAAAQLQKTIISATASAPAAPKTTTTTTETVTITEEIVLEQPKPDSN
ncbi:hypothetical protein HDU97_008476 [Phlyctochytrium planicorne]|nr:hypothetical protein HDU97_008476 [Phlyctochytrium planicorne]